MVSNITLQSIPRPIQETLNKFIPTENTVIKNTTVSIKVGNHSFLSTQDHVNSAADTSSLSKLVTLCFIWLAIVIGNALVVVARRISKRKHIADFLIASLAMVDLINGFGPVTISIIMYVLHPSGFNGNYNDYLCKFYNWAATSLRLSACFLSTAMALDRVLSVQKPIYYRTKLSTQNVKGTILFIILAAIIIASMPFAGWSKVYPFDAVCSFDFGSSYAILIAVLGYVQLVIVLISYILVVHGLAGFIGRQVAMREQQMSRERELSVRRSNLFDRRKSSSGLLMLELGRFRTSKRFAKIMGVVCFLFYVSWMPIVVSMTFLAKSHDLTQLR